MKLIKICEAQHTELKTRAAMLGITLADYVKEVLRKALDTHLVSCSQCGNEFRVEISQKTGFSHCGNHGGLKNER